ncbi:unnamed protein product [Rotaria sordida]|uniref:Guanylate cyclase n=1 Tax=Rotaria sordida TaxID=392033 RepID=A0A813YV48_9BILA|nr:unnamed protein product [Rotaria sordida]CAF0992821.1 unnamed protein product [Rotaria sordida]CAF3585172.1 unnamed protein product [Rotaria sordida]
MWFLLITVTFLLLLIGKIQISLCYTTVQIAVLLPTDPQLPFDMQKVKPAIDLAVIEVDRRRLLIDRNSFEVRYGDTNSSYIVGPLLAIDFYAKRQADVFLGPVDGPGLAAVSRYSPHWRIPVISPGGGFNYHFDNKREYQLLTRMLHSSKTIVHFISRVILPHFNWTSVRIIAERNVIEAQSECYMLMGALCRELRHPNNKGESKDTCSHSIFDVDRKNETKEKLRKTLDEAKTEARILFICMDSNLFRDFLLMAYDLGMINGEYVFVYLDIFRLMRKDMSLISWYRNESSESENIKARRAFETVLIVAVKRPETERYRQFSYQVNALQEKINNDSTSIGKLVNPYVATFYDAVLLYAYGLNRTIESNQNASDGFAVVRKMWNVSFEGSNGIVQISETGDRVSDYSLFDLNPESGQFEEVGTYFGVNSSFIPLKDIYWIDDVKKTPLDVPPCGFDGSKCLVHKNPALPWIYFTASVTSVIFILIIIAFWYFKRVSFEAQLKAMNWIIEPDDLFSMEDFGLKYKTLKRDRHKRTSVHHVTLFDEENDIENVVAVKTARFKGSIVALKLIQHKTRIDINRLLLMEVKTIKDMQSEYLVRFIGACLDPPCLVNEYCSKGNLQNLLENSQIRLDDMFKYSIIHDIVKGIMYIHNSDLQSHGNLKSTNCLVGSRFVVKISDYGIPSLRCPVHQKYPANCEQYYKSLLWSSPEIIRDPHAPIQGSQKGDVYSFSIILHEIIYRRGLFAINETGVTPKEIFLSIKSGNEIRPPFLGDNTLYEIGYLMKRCWQENSNDRPDFTSILNTMKKLSKKFDNENLVDNLLQRMEQYTNNLEDLVKERTNDYLLEKKKAEELLYRLLPQSVTAELIAGKQVTAESFECVTIYFSDIVGFTRISAESTPLQIVSLLNDLYTCFDSIIEAFDIYKVETIGDAYMVVSGLPTRNGDLHAREISRMALTILDAVIHFRIRHRPDEQLKIRIGIHSGPCVAGVVGLKMPRYCLFGDTVNVASRMESNGQPLRIHISPCTKALLDKFQTFITKSRGQVNLKGKGEMLTYWLLGERDGLQVPFSNDSDLNDNNNTTEKLNSDH